MCYLFQRWSENKSEFDINWADKYGQTYLRIASTYGHTNLVSYLMGRGALIDKPDMDGMTPLYMAVDKNHVDTVQLLLDAGADPNCQPYDEEKRACPLYQAAQRNYPEVCDLLLRFGANIDQKFKGGTPLKIATQNKHTNIIEMLQAATDRKREEQRNEIIVNVAKAKIEQAKEEKLREDKEKMCQDLWYKAREGNIEAFQKMENLPKPEFGI